MAEIFVYANRLNSFPIFGDEAYSFSQLQVSAVLADFSGWIGEMGNAYVWDDGIVRGFVVSAGGEAVSYTHLDVYKRQTEDMSEIFADAWLMQDDDPRVLAREAEIRAYGNICPGIAREKVLKQAKLSLTIDQWMADHECVASAVQCWDSVEANYGLSLIHI